jgi:hypothetical protein
MRNGSGATYLAEINLVYREGRSRGKEGGEDCALHGGWTPLIRECGVPTPSQHRRKDLPDVRLPSTLRHSVAKIPIRALGVFSGYGSKSGSLLYV